MNERLPYEQVERLCREAIAGSLGLEVPQVRPELRLVEDLGLDSMAIADLMLTIEERLPTNPPEDAPQMQTLEDVRRLRVRDVVDIVHRYQR